MVVAGDASTAPRKIGGVLVETCPDASLAALGVGMNVDIREDEFPPEVRNSATSLFEAFGQAPDRREVCAGFVRELEKRLEAPWRLAPELREHLIGVGQERALESGTGTVVDIDDEMRLVVRLSDGRTEAIAFSACGDCA
jgi:BirA family biotin operon repressor/biotin-[acetyl-CoA-carboxylase] ligase